MKDKKEALEHLLKIIEHAEESNVFDWTLVKSSYCGLNKVSWSCNCPLCELFWSQGGSLCTGCISNKILGRHCITRSDDGCGPSGIMEFQERFKNKDYREKIKDNIKKLIRGEIEKQSKPGEIEGNQRK